MNTITIETFMDACRDFEAAAKLKYHLEIFLLIGRIK